MRYFVATGVLPTLLLGGCSLLYNPSSIDKPVADARMIDTGEVAVDVEIRADAMPLDLTLTDAYPPAIAEGTGTGASRAGIVVVRGHNLIKDPAYNLAVTLTPSTAGAVTLDGFEASGNGDFLALVVTAPVVDACHDGTSVPVGVTVMQSDGAAGTVTKTLDAAFSITCLDELTAAPASADALKAMYSVVNLTTGLDFPAAAAKAALIRSASSITIGGAVDASASGSTPGPGGTAGGDTGATGMGQRPGLGATNAGAGGGGAGFLTAGTGGGTGTLGGAGAAGAGAGGDAWISKYSDNTSSGGGGGASSLGGTGGVGGGGGGTLELTAPGDVSVGALTANGAAGESTGGGDGGAGTGGVIVVRAGNMLTASTVAVTKGAQAGNGGASSDGRVRVAAAKGSYPTGGTACTVPLSTTCNVVKGPMFVDVPVKTTLQTGPITLRGTPNDASSTLRVFDRAGNPVDGATYTPVFGTTGNATLMPTLKAGYNNVCVWVAGAAPDIAESVTCQEIAFLPP